jgi:hypothetical protein
MRTDTAVTDVFLLVLLLRFEYVGVYYLSNLGRQSKQRGFVRVRHGIAVHEEMGCRLSFENTNFVTRVRYTKVIKYRIENER